MISEELRDAENWSNGCCFAITAINYILKYKTVILNCKYFIVLLFYSIFDQIKAALWEFLRNF